MVETAKAEGIDWDWTENEHGDRVPAEPAEPSAWPPGRLVEKLEELFASEEMASAGRKWQQENWP